jgi:surfeit locus 1 family protein
MTARRVWPVLAVASLGVTMLIALGVWQVQRMSWKNELIASIEAKATVEPISLSDALERSEVVEFLKVFDTAQFDYGATLFFLDTLEGQPAWRLITPYRRGDGTVVFVNRGVVPEELRDPAKRPGSDPPGPREIVGQITEPRPRKGSFTPDNDSTRNLWFWWDRPAMLKAAGIAADADVAPFMVNLSPRPGETGWPRAQPLTAALRNNHLGYAITWFGLAIALVAITAVFLMRRAS